MLITVLNNMSNTFHLKPDTDIIWTTWRSNELSQFHVYVTYSHV